MWKWCLLWGNINEAYDKREGIWVNELHVFSFLSFNHFFIFFPTFTRVLLWAFMFNIPIALTGDPMWEPPSYPILIPSCTLRYVLSLNQCTRWVKLFWLSCLPRGLNSTLALLAFCAPYFFLYSFSILILIGLWFIGCP